MYFRIKQGNLPPSWNEALGDVKIQWSNIAGIQDTIVHQLRYLQNLNISQTLYRIPTRFARLCKGPHRPSVAIPLLITSTHPTHTTLLLSIGVHHHRGETTEIQGCCIHQVNREDTESCYGPPSMPTTSTSGRRGPIRDVHAAAPELWRRRAVGRGVRNGAVRSAESYGDRASCVEM